MSDVITDTERLDFMLAKHRKLIYEVVGSHLHESLIDIYVEEGFMADKTYDSVRITVGSLSKDCTPEQRREAIDIAILETKNSSN